MGAGKEKQARTALFLLLSSLALCLTAACGLAKKEKRFVIPKGATLTVVLHEIATERRVGEDTGRSRQAVTALVEEEVRFDRRVVVQEGTEVRGGLFGAGEGVEDPGVGRAVLHFNEIEGPDGSPLSIETEPIRIDGSRESGGPVETHRTAVLLDPGQRIIIRLSEPAEMPAPPAGDDGA